MKSALKKVLSLMLVAMLLVTAIPFQASAAEGDEEIVSAVRKEGSIQDVDADPENDADVDADPENDANADAEEDIEGEPAGQADDPVKGKGELPEPIEPGTPSDKKDEDEKKDPMEYVEYIEPANCHIYVTVSDGSKVLVTNYKLPYTLTKSDLKAQFEELTGKILDDDEMDNKDNEDYAEATASIDAAKFLLSDVEEVVSIPDSYQISKAICKLDGRSLLVSIAGSSWQDGEGNVAGGNGGSTGNTGNVTPNTPATPSTPDGDDNTDSKNTIKVKLLFNQSQNVGESFTYTIKEGKSVSIRTLLKAWDSNWNDDYTFTRANNDRLGRTTDIDDTVRATDGYINIRLADRNNSDSADSEPTSDTIKLRVMFNDSTSADESFTYTTTKSVSIKTILNAWYGDWSREYTFKRADVDDVKTTNVNKAVKPGQVVYVRLLDKDGSTGSAGTNKFPWDANLYIYLNNKVDKYAKKVDISNGIAVDGVVSKKEVESVVKQYYSAKNSDGIQYDGLYLARGNWVNNFANDLDKYDQITGINEMRQEDDVNIIVMVTNANPRSGSNNSNSTNPKTGDGVVMTVSALGVTASALAAAYYVSKKRSAK